jgi:hypothetical protein
MISKQIRWQQVIHAILWSVLWLKKQTQKISGFPAQWPTAQHLGAHHENL